VRNKLMAAVRWRDAFLRRLIDAERRRLDDGGDSEKKSMLAVLLSLQKSEPELYTDTMIMALCGVSVSNSTFFRANFAKLISHYFK